MQNINKLKAVVVEAAVQQLEKFQQILTHYTNNILAAMLTKRVQLLGLEKLKKRFLLVLLAAKNTKTHTPELLYSGTPLLNLETRLLGKKL